MSNDRNNPVMQISGGDPLHRFILQTFASIGRSPTLDEIRRQFSLESLGEADAMVESLARGGAIHRNPGDASITHAYPFSNEPTAHRVRLADGPAVFAMCAIDALGIPFMVRRDADIDSQCATCGAAVHVDVRDGAVSEYAPEATVVWLTDPAEGCVAATDLCPELNFFCSAEHLDAWASARPNKNGQQLTFEEALARGREVFEGLLPGDDRS